MKWWVYTERGSVRSGDYSAGMSEYDNREDAVRAIAELRATYSDVKVTLIWGEEEDP